MWRIIAATIGAASATAVSAQIQDLNGNNLIPPMSLPATAGLQQAVQFSFPVRIPVPAAAKTYVDPGGNTVTLAGKINAISVTLAGAGGSFAIERV